jgi:5-methylcytosine-specific restriction endonuclease McrA
MRRRSSTLGELLNLVFLPVVWAVRSFVGRKRAPPAEVKRFYSTVEWKRLRYAHLAQHPACVLCGRSARDGSKLNVDHIKPLSYCRYS